MIDKLTLVKKIILPIFLLPILLLIDLFHSQRSKLKKFLFVLVILIFFVSTWWNGYHDFFSIFRRASYNSGISDEIRKVPVSGTSMLPTIKDGSEIELKNPNKYGLVRGDIVSFTNKETGGLHYLKRIVGVGGETISVKNGHVFINGKALQEDYTLNDLPTYGNTFLIDCESYTVPKDHFLVLGDNRTVSSDSRVLGFVKDSEIDGVIKTGVSAKFVDSTTQKNFENSNPDPEEFVKKLNELRQKNKVDGLVTHSTLNNLAKKRAEEISNKFEDWKNNAVPINSSLDSSGYLYNLAHEFVTFGYLDETAIIEQIMDSPLQKDQFLSSKYLEMGIGVAEKKNKECSFPVVSIILSWPHTPTYDQKVINSWNEEIKATNKILNDMQSWVGYPGADQTQVRKIIDNVAKENQIATRIYNKEKNSEWLTEKDHQDIKEYDQLVKESNKLLDEFFKDKNVKGIKTERPENIRRL